MADGSGQQDVTAPVLVADCESSPLPAQLLVWLSPAFPVGAFAYSHGLEWAVASGAVKDRSSLEDWLAALGGHGALRTDLTLLAMAWLAAEGEEWEQVRYVADLAVALQPTAERHLETVTQGNAFLAAIRAAWPCPAVTRLGEIKGGDVAYPVAVGIAAGGHAVPLPATLEAYAIAFTTNLVSAAIRLGVIGQTDGQRVIARLLPSLLIAATAAASATEDDLGSATFAADLASMHHETQYTRLFRS